MSNRKKTKASALVDFCYGKIGVPYVYGMKGKSMTEDDFDDLHKKYGDRFVPYSDRKKVGKVCVDCSGLISWACNVSMNSAGWRERATVVEPISTIRNAPVGALVWMTGHIGVYVGKVNGVHSYIAADGSKYGVRLAPMSANDFTHWLLVEDVFDYEMEDDEVVTKEKVEIDGKVVVVDAIRKDGRVYPYIRDIGPHMGYEVTNDGKTPKLNKKV